MTFCKVEIRYNIDGEIRAQTMQCQVERRDNC